MALLVAVGVAITGVVDYLRAAKALHEAGEQQLAVVQDARARALEQYYRSVSGSPGLLVQNGDMHDILRLSPVLEKAADAQPSAEYLIAVDYFTELIHQVVKTRRIGGVTLVSRDGTIVFDTTGSEPTGARVSDVDWAPTALARIYFAARADLQTTQPLFASGGLRPGSPDQASLFALPVNVDRHFLGVLAVSVSELEVDQILSLGSPQAVRTQLRPLATADATTAVKRAVSGEQGMLRRTDDDGAAVLVVYRPFEINPEVVWALVSEIPEKQFKAPIHALGRYLLIAGSASALLLMWTGFSYSKRLSSRLEYVTRSVTDLAFEKLPAGVSPGTIGPGGGGELTQALEVFRARNQALVQQTEMREEAEISFQRTLAELEKVTADFQEAARVNRAILDSALDCIIGIDFDGRILEFNSAAEATFGYRRRETLGRRAVDVLVAAAGAQTLQEALDGLTDSTDTEQGITGQRLRVQSRRSSGAEFPAEVSVTRVATDPPMLAVFLRDISESVKAEEQLKASRERFLLAAEGAAQGIWEWDLVNGNVYYSRQAKRLLGFEPDEFPDTQEAWAKRLHPEDRERVNHALSSHFRHRTPFEVECRALHKSGKYHWYQTSGQAIWNSEGIATRVAGSLIDITNRVHDRAELMRAKENAEASLRAKDDFLASMSHELRTPLTAVLGLSEAVQEGVYGSLTDKQRESLAGIESSGRHLLALINDILDLAKVGSGELEIRTGPVDVTSLCESSLQLIRQQASRKDITVNCDIDPRVGTLDTDKRRVMQILINLLSNAVKFTPIGGKVGVDVGLSTDESSIEFAVWDTGVGIEEADRSRLFEPFVQLDGSLSRQYEGTGLGLALVYRMTRLLDGQVSVESEVGYGSRFTIALPWTPADERVGDRTELQLRRGAQKADVEQAKPEDRRPLILLAEDNTTTVTLISSYLVAKGYQVLVAGNGEEVLAAAHDHKPDLILMDVQMPILDGLQTTRRLRETNGDLRHVPIVALTAQAMPGDRERCLAAGVDDYLSKPIRLAELLQRIHHYCHDQVAPS